uniref:Pyrroline-5-carboxylate reductase n=2 Tax=Meloidogyne TaxID=189290 RepID=A0A914M0N5_MELIC
MDGTKNIKNLFLECFNEEEPQINVIGGGKMAKALVAGFVNSGFINKSNIFVCTRSEATAKSWRSQGFTSAYPKDVFYSEVKKPRAIILIAIKPQMFPSFINEVKANEWFYFGLPGILCISIMSGISLQHFDKELKSVGFDGHSMRLMPNVNCAVSSGTLVLSADSETPQELVELVSVLSSYVGKCIRVDEAHFNAASSISGCGPAFIALVIEALADGGVVAGLSRELANQLAADMVKGTAQLFMTKMASLSPTLDTPSPAQLKDQVCSPAGTTIEGVRELEKHGVRSAFIEAVQSSTRRAFELSQ